MTTPRYGPGIEIAGRMTDAYAEILTPEALAFTARLQRAFGERRSGLLARRSERQRTLDRGALPDFFAETRAIREADWTCAPVPADIQDRRGGITRAGGPQMNLKPLHSGARG